RPWWPALFHTASARVVVSANACRGELGRRPRGSVDDGDRLDLYEEPLDGERGDADQGGGGWRLQLWDLGPCPSQLGGVGVGVAHDVRVLRDDVGRGGPWRLSPRPQVAEGPAGRGVSWAAR